MVYSYGCELKLYITVNLGNPAIRKVWLKLKKCLPQEKVQR